MVIRAGRMVTSRETGVPALYWLSPCFWAVTQTVPAFLGVRTPRLSTVASPLMGRTV